MTTDMLIVIAILAGAVILFLTEAVRVDVVAMMVIAALMASGILSVQEAISGFSSSVVVTIASLFIVGGAVFHTGLADRLGQLIVRFAGTNENRLLLVLMISIAAMSAFVSSTGVVALMLPAVISLSKRLNISPSRLLMPIAFSALLGGAATLIGTPPNILVNEALLNAGYKPFNFFSFTPIAALLIVSGIVFIMTVGKRLIPVRIDPTALAPLVTPSDLFELYHLPENLLRVRVRTDSPIAGKRLIDTGMRGDAKITVLRITRQARGSGEISVINHPEPSTIIQAADTLILQGKTVDLRAASKRYQLEVLTDSPIDPFDLISNEVGIAEVILRPRSTLLNRTVADVAFGSRYHLTVLELQRPGTDEVLDAAGTPLKFGDLLLVQGLWSDIFALKRQFRHDFIVMGEPEAIEFGAFAQTAKMPLVLVILGVMLLMIVIDNSLLTLASLLAAIATVLTGCLTMDEAYDSIDWKTLFLIAGMLPLSIALEQVGLVENIASGIDDILGGYGPTAVLVGLFVITALVTQFLSNTVTAVLLAPIAVGVAGSLGVHPAAFLMAIAIAASTAFATPIASPVNTLIMSAGNYRFTDYMRLGLPMVFISLIITALVVPLLFPF